ncbi:hypothetical protein BDQ12DRAFT_673039 [Crucibulum laeve]|uniref:Mid2 domain-containing protein n=1 Tax=Crucibulum laeve TaxID=68775 RepID=A0A5C3MGT9_9AGAR|nr:hypothetical protein BDQ12DRAFT_673039 [Crucibulum laeve]
MDPSLLSTLIFSTLSLFVIEVNAKGGGKSSSGSKSSSKSSTKTKTGSTIIFVGGSGGQAAHCKDSVTGQIVRCPSNHKKNIIIIVVISSIVGLTLIGLLVWFILRHRRNKRSLAEKTIDTPAPKDVSKGAYKKLDNSTEDQVHI